MVVDNKATVTYVQLLKEDLVIMRIVPNDGPVPDFEAGQFLTLGYQIQQMMEKLLDEHIQLHLIQKTKSILNL